MSQEDVFRELRKISRVLTLTNGPAIEKELSKIASSKERKQMWVNLNGTRMPKDIADAVKVTPQAVSLFLIAGATADLIEYQRGKPPRRVLDYVPPEWIALVEVPSEPQGSTEDPQATLPTENKKEGGTP